MLSQNENRMKMEKKTKNTMTKANGKSENQMDDQKADKEILIIEPMKMEKNPKNKMTKATNGNPKME